MEVQNETLVEYRPGTSEKAARTMGGELGVINTDGTGPQRVADQAGHIAMWTPDGRALVFGRMVALEDPKDPQAPFRTERYMAMADGSGLKLLLTDESADGIQPLGWSQSEQIFYSAKITLCQNPLIGLLSPPRFPMDSCGSPHFHYSGLR